MAFGKESPVWEKALILPLSFFFGLSLFVSLSGMEIFSSLIILIVLLSFNWSEGLSRFWNSCSFSSFQMNGGTQLKKLVISCPKEILCLISFVFFTLLSLSVNGYSGELPIYLLGFRWILFLYFLPRFFKLSEEGPVLFFRGLFLGATASFLNSLFQFFTAWDFVRQTFIYHRVSFSVPRVTSFFNLPTTYAYSLSLFLLFPLAFFFYKKNPKKNYLMIPFFALALISLLLSYTRGAWIASFCSFLCFFWFVRRRILIFLTPLVLVFGILLFFVQPGFQNRIRSLFDFSHSSNSQRIELWFANWHIFRDSPVFGVGLHKNDKLIESYHKKLNHWYGFIGHAHNSYLQILSGTGIFGFISFILFLFFIIKRILSYLTPPLYGDPVVWATGLSILVSFLVGCLFDCNLRDAEVRYMFISCLSVFFFFSENPKAHGQIKKLVGWR